MTGSPQVRCAVVIPAYRPSAVLIDLVRALNASGKFPIILVDDGSGPEFAPIFEKASAPGGQSQHFGQLFRFELMEE